MLSHAACMEKESIRRLRHAAQYAASGPAPHPLIQCVMEYAQMIVCKVPGSCHVGCKLCLMLPLLFLQRPGFLLFCNDWYWPILHMRVGLPSLENLQNDHTIDKKIYAFCTIVTLPVPLVLQQRESTCPSPCLHIPAPLMPS